MRGPQVFLFDEPLSNLDAELRVQTRVEQIGAPMQLYDHPDNVFVAGFIGSPRMHFLSAVVTAQGLDLGGITLPLRDLRSTPAIGTSVRLGIRPEHLDQTQGVRLPATVEVVERLGSIAFVHARLGNGQAPSSPNSAIAMLAPVSAWICILTRCGRGCLMRRAQGCANRLGFRAAQRYFARCIAAVAAKNGFDFARLGAKYCNFNGLYGAPAVGCADDGLDGSALPDVSPSDDPSRHALYRDGDRCCNPARAEKPSAGL